MIVTGRKCEFGRPVASICSVGTGLGHGRTAGPDCAAVAERPTSRLASACDSHGLPEADLSSPHSRRRWNRSHPHIKPSTSSPPSQPYPRPPPLSPLHSREADRCLALGPMQQVSRLSSSTSLAVEGALDHSPERQTRRMHLRLAAPTNGLPSSLPCLNANVPPEKYAGSD